VVSGAKWIALTELQYPSLACTRCRVYPLRHRGRRLPWREVANAPSFEGDLSTYYLSLANARYFVAQLLGPGDAFRKPLLPQLYEPVLTSLGNAVLMLRGFEREGEAATVQEWRCEVLGE
jgi:hypothetical protein